MCTFKGSFSLSSKLKVQSILRLKNQPSVGSADMMSNLVIESIEVESEEESMLGLTSREAR